MDKHQIMEIMRDEDFVNEILDMQTTEEVKEAFAEKGLELSLEEIDIISQIINKMVDKNTTELSDEDLEEISGGSSAVAAPAHSSPAVDLIATGIAGKIICDKSKISSKWLKK